MHWKVPAQPKHLKTSSVKKKLHNRLIIYSEGAAASLRKRSVLPFIWSRLDYLLLLSIQEQTNKLIFFYLCWIFFYSFFKKCFWGSKSFSFFKNKYHNQSFWANPWFPKAFFPCWNCFRKCRAFMQMRPRLIKYAYICMHYESIIKSSVLMMFEWND